MEVKTAEATSELATGDSASSSAATNTSPLVPQVGQVFNVRRQDGECLPAEVLETRTNEKEKKTEYFVHFENCLLDLARIKF
jgi:hypothetical protein